MNHFYLVSLGSVKKTQFACYNSPRLARDVIYLQARFRFDPRIAKPARYPRAGEKLLPLNSELFFLLLLKIDFVHRCVCFLPTVDFQLGIIPYFPYASCNLQ